MSATVTHSLSLPGWSIWVTMACHTGRLRGVVGHAYLAADAQDRADGGPRRGNMVRPKRITVGVP